MNEQLIKYIELCLTDGIISDKEREVIFRKAKALGVDEDECEILVDAYTQKVNNKLQQNTNVISKSNRNFTPKTVKKIKPAPLDQESKLLEEVDTLTEKHQKVSSSYDSVLDDLKATTNEINKIKKELSNDFNEYKASYSRICRDNIVQYFIHVEKLIYEKYGKAYVRNCTSDEIKELSLSNHKTINKFLSEESNWNNVSLNKKQNVWVVTFLISFGFFIYLLIYATGVEFWTLSIITLAILLLTNYWVSISSIKFKDNLKSILKNTYKEYDKSYKKTEQQKNNIDKYEKLVKYNISTSTQTTTE